MAHSVRPVLVAMKGTAALLREATREAHADAERDLALPHGLRDRAHYARLMSALHLVYASLERELAAVEASAGGEGLPGGRDRTALIAADLAALGHAPPRPDVGGPGIVGDHASAAGVRYVLEGASLGGVVLAPRIEAHLGLGPGEATRHWRGEGPRTGTSWRAFRARLDAWGEGRGTADIDRAVVAAEATFGLVAGAMRTALDGDPA